MLQVDDLLKAVTLSRGRPTSAPVEHWTDFVLLDPVGTVLYASASVCGPMGLDVEEVVGRPLLEVVDSGDREEVATWLQRISSDVATSSGAGDWVHLIEVALRCGDGTRVGGVLRGTPIRHGARLLGVRVGVRSGAAGDGGGLDEVLAELMVRADELRRSNEELADCAHAVAHDLRTPLTVVTMTAELLTRMMGPDLDEDAQSVLAMLLQGVRRLHALIDDGLTASLDDPGADPVVVDCDALVGDLLCDLADELAGAQVDVGPLGTVRANRVQLLRVFQNLLTNAVRYRSPDRPLSLAVTARDLGTERVFSVVDSGIGIPAEHREDAFTMFRRLTDVGDGTGMGLAICRRLVERHGGRIWIDDAPGGGTAVSFALPRSGGAPAHDAGHGRGAQVWA